MGALRQNAINIRPEACNIIGTDPQAAIDQMISHYKISASARSATIASMMLNTPNQGHARPTINPLLYDVPEQFETDRLLLRSIRSADAPARYDAIRASETELKPWIPWAEDTSAGRNERHVRESRIKFLKREVLEFLMFRKADSVLVGEIGLYRINWSVPHFEIGYWLSTRHTGNGYATEAVKGMTMFCHDKLQARRVTLCINPRNTDSRLVAEQSGFVFESTARSDHRDFMNGALADTLIFALTWPD